MSILLRSSSRHPLWIGSRTNGGRGVTLKIWSLVVLALATASVGVGCGGSDGDSGDSTGSKALENRQVKCEEEFLEEVELEEHPPANPAASAESFCGSKREEEEGKTPPDVKEAEEKREEAEANGTAKLTGCPESQETYEIAEESMEEAEKAIEDGKEVAQAEESLEVAEELAESAEESCESSKELEASEEKICGNSPRELREALEVEDTPANRNYIRVYEEACGRSVLP
jgi:hypothetical protein